MNSKIQGNDYLFFKVWRNIVIRKNIFIQLKYCIKYCHENHQENWEKLISLKEKELYDQIYSGEKIISDDLTKVNNKILKLYYQYNNDKTPLKSKIQKNNEKQIYLLLNYKNEIIENLKQFQIETNNNNPNNNNKEKIGFLKKISNKFKKNNKNNKEEKMINFIKSKKNFKTINKKDKKLFTKMDDEGRTIFHFYCKYKSDENFEEDFKGLEELNICLTSNDSNERGPIYYLIENEDQKVSTRLLVFLVSKNIITIDFHMLTQLIYHCCIFDRNQLVKLIVILGLPRKIKYCGIRNRYFGLPHTSISIALNRFGCSLKYYTYIPTEEFKNEIKRHIVLLIYQFLLGDYSQETIYSILDQYGLSNPYYLLKLAKIFFINLWDTIKKFYLCANFVNELYGSLGKF
ncbi:hypothetical protein ACTFIZ_002908 [Dictyostelium cf. discoideum]